jgi:N-methylhydantoinase B
VLSAKNVLPPYGVCGGMPGAPNRFFVIRDGQEREPSSLPGKVSGFLVCRGDRIVLQTSGGGGYGDPLDRDPDAVATDVNAGVVSRRRAELTYGLVFDGDQVDADATRRRRADLGRARPRVSLRVLPGPPYRDGRRACRLSADVAARLGVQQGDIVELADPLGAPFRAWVDGIADDPGELAWLGADIVPLLTRAASAVEIRRASPRRLP